MDALSEYLNSHTTPPDAVAVEAERWAHNYTTHPQMLCGPYEGTLLSLLCRSVNARCALEIGAFVGYSTLYIARGLGDGGVLHTFEVNDEYEDAIVANLRKSGLEEKVRLHIGDAAKLIPSLADEIKQRVDFAFIDAGKRNMKEHYDLVLPMMCRGGLVVIDNVLWGHKVTDLEQFHDMDTKTIHFFNEYVQNDPRVENVMLDVRDGLLICSVL